MICQIQELADRYDRWRRWRVAADEDRKAEAGDEKHERRGEPDSARQRLNSPPDTLHEDIPVSCEYLARRGPRIRRKRTSARLTVSDSQCPTQTRSRGRLQSPWTHQ